MKVSGLETLLQPLKYRQVIALATYPTPASQTKIPASPASQVRMVVELGNGGSDYYDIGLDGGDPHLLPLQVPCFAYLAITRDGKWGACVTNQGVATFRLLPGAPAGGKLEEHIVAPLDPRYGYTNLSWDPTGHYLAVGRFSLSHGPTSPLDILAVSPTHDHALLAVRFSGVPEIDSLDWSPDGDWLMVGERGAGQSYILPLSQLVPLLPTFGQPTTYLTIKLDSQYKVPYRSLWRPGFSAMLTEISSGGLVNQYDPATKKNKVIGDLGFPPSEEMIGFVCAATWTMDSRYLIFALCDPGGGDHLGLPPKIFVYDAKNA